MPPPLPLPSHPEQCCQKGGEKKKENKRRAKVGAGGVKPGTHLAKGTLVNKKVTHHELPVTPRVILNPLPRDLALAEFDFMNCEAAMLKVCKLDINWAAEGWGAERVGVCSCAGDVTGFGHRLARSGEEAVDETLSRRVAEQ